MGGARLSAVERSFPVSGRFVTHGRRGTPPGTNFPGRGPPTGPSSGGPGELPRAPRAPRAPRWPPRRPAPGTAPRPRPAACRRARTPRTTSRCSAGSWRWGRWGRWCCFSSAVPVLPATCTPGICADVPVPNSTTATISFCTSRAIRLDVTCTKRAGWWACSVGSGRRPPIAIVAATSVISSVLASTLPCPIADDPTASALPMSLAEGIWLSAAPWIDGDWLNPNRSATSTNRLRSELGPQRSEHRVAGDRERVEEASRRKPRRRRCAACSRRSPPRRHRGTRC